jgi:GTP-binding protein HflX
MQEKYRFVIVHLIDPRKDVADADRDLEEIKSLITTFGGATVVKILQRRDFPDSDSFIGKGKVEELTEIVKNEKIDAVVLNAIVKPGQVFNLKRTITGGKEDVDVWDRVDLILNIFSKHANTAESKLQIELARMRHMGPRIYGLGGTVLSRQGGGIGVRGIGETNTELMKRHWRDQIKQTQDKLKKLTLEREKQIAHRKQLGLKTVSIVGYTNAGKTSLFNLLSKKKKLVENALFATLDSAVGELYLPDLQSTILVSDTIGFIQNLPPALIDAFKSTLLESVNADILLHVVDSSDPEIESKIQAVDSILAELQVQPKASISVFNKIDLLDENKITEINQKFHELNPLMISTFNKLGIDTLIQKISDNAKLL